MQTNEISVKCAENSRVTYLQFFNHENNLTYLYVEPLFLDWNFGIISSNATCTYINMVVPESSRKVKFIDLTSISFM